MTNCVLAASRLYPEMLPLLHIRSALRRRSRTPESTGWLQVNPDSKPRTSRLGKVPVPCAYPIVDSAVRMIRRIHTFQQAAVTKYFFNRWYPFLTFKYMLRILGRIHILLHIARLLKLAAAFTSPNILKI